ncbi:hypothetical protein B0O80DRAFT_454099 [Mortierella sp. GBAus27b]|nr:hypothetical protein BGX31_001776 [Mortierella sp. GBA43]KAI8352250.1 hypothetical protein B0O80DRAFT_454099 [Mortierella sp. GBAus27b]
MLGLSEIDDLIRQHLDHHDLAQCARVSKRWHAIVAPYIWHSLYHSYENLSAQGILLQQAARLQQALPPGALPQHTHTQRTQRHILLRRTILDDYIQKRTFQEEGHLEVCRVHRQARSSSMSALSKYGPLIRELGCLNDLLVVLAPLRSEDNLQQAQDSQHTREMAGQGEEPTAYELLAHLLKHCSSQVRVNQFSFIANDILQDDNPCKPALHLVIRVARHIQANISFSGSRTQFSKLRNLLNRCSDGLEKLSVHINITHGKEEEEEEKDEEDQADDESEDWTSLKQLNMGTHSDIPNAKAFWSWLWKRCNRLERLQVTAIRGTYNLAEGIVMYMPNIREIALGRRVHGQLDFTDEEVAALLSGSQTGWRGVTIRRSATFHKAAMGVLAKHYSTLEEFDLEGHANAPSIDLAQLLRYGNRLRRVIYTGWRLAGQNEYPFIDAKEFTDRDPITGELREWECEASLESITVKITGIPRAGQGRDIQYQVYDRLARLTSLKGLWLGQRAGVQPDCLEISLRSGLDKLAGLKALETLDVSGMKTRVGLAEVQWMVEHWPKLRSIYGIDKGEDGRAADWLREHHPKVHVS